MNKLRVLEAAGVAGALALVYGGASAPEKFWPTLLLVGLNPLTLSLGAAVLLALQRLTGADWLRGFERVARAMTRCYWPAAFLVFAAVAFGGEGFTGWAHGGGHVPSSQRLWLSPAFLLARTAAYLVVWGVSMRRIRSVASAAVFCLLFGVTATLASFDWLMAIEPGWSSTIFGVYFFAGCFVGALGAVAAATVLLHELGLLAEHPSEEQLHDLGKMLFGFSVFWAYIWYCQYMLIWYTNNPEEAAFFLRRHAGGWAVLSLTSLGMNWVVPFLALLPQWTKRRADLLLRVGVVVMAGHWLDLYLVTMPRFSGPSPTFSVWEGLVFVGALAAYAATLAREARGALAAEA